MTFKTKKFVKGYYHNNNTSYTSYVHSDYSCDVSFDTYEEALKEAKKTVLETKEDVVIYKDYAVVKFPEPSYEVVLLD